MTPSTAANHGYLTDATEILRGVNEAELAIEFDRLRSHLCRMVSLRLSPCLSTRVDPSDVVQEAFLRASTNFSQYRAADGMSLSGWLRLQTRYAVGDCHRRNLKTQKRDARREEQGFCDISASALDQLAESMSSTSSVVARQELGQRIRASIEQMSALDREILILRHLEDISIADAAVELNISLDAAKKRHLRAIRKLQQLCEGLHENDDQQQS